MPNGGADGGLSSSESGSAIAQNACVPFLFSSRMDPRTTLTTSGTSRIASNNLSKWSRSSTCTVY